MSDADEPRDDAAPEQPDEQNAGRTDETASEQPVADDQATPPTRPSSPSAAAARRARRIGGRPAGGPRPDAEPEQPTDLTKKAEQPAIGAPAAAGAADEEDTELGAPEPSPQPVVITAVPAWLNWAPAAVLSAGALVMVVLLIVFSHGVWWGPDPKSIPASRSPAVVREQVLAAAKTCVATANTYKYTDLEAYESKALACTTGEFTNQLRQTIDGVIKVNAPRLKSSQTTQINRGGIEAVSDDGRQWTIVLYGQLTVTNNQNKQPRTDPFAAEVRMDKANGKWLIGALTTISSPLS